MLHNSVKVHNFVCFLNDCSSVNLLEVKHERSYGETEKSQVDYKPHYGSLHETISERKGSENDVKANNYQHYDQSDKICLMNTVRSRAKSKRKLLLFIFKQKRFKLALRLNHLIRDTVFEDVF